jgi:hypothetical protein
MDDGPIGETISRLIAVASFPPIMVIIFIVGLYYYIKSQR